MNCQICNKKISRFDNAQSILIIKSSVQVCEQCYRHIQRLQNKDTSFEDDVNQLIERLPDKSAYKNELQELLYEAHGIHSKIREEKLAEDTEKQYWSENFKATTGFSFDGYSIEKYCEVITANIVQGTGALSDIAASINDFVGTRSGNYENSLDVSQKKALDILKTKAVDLGANALIGVNYNTAVAGGNMFVVTVSGTAVKISENHEDYNRE